MQYKRGLFILPRGLIYDRNNKLLVANKPVYDLMVVPENIIAFDNSFNFLFEYIKKRSFREN